MLNMINEERGRGTGYGYPISQPQLRHDPLNFYIFFPATRPEPEFFSNT